MKTTILVSVSEKHEQAVDVLSVELANPPAPLSAGLSVEHAYKLLEQLQPAVEKMRLTDYDRIDLTYFVDGVPRFHEAWYRTTSGYPGEAVMPIAPGQKLYRLPPTEISLGHVVL